MAGVAKPKGSRLGIIGSVIGVCVVLTLLAFEVYLIMTRHPTGSRLYWDIAYLLIDVVAVIIFVMRYRLFMAASRTTKISN